MYQILSIYYTLFANSNFFVCMCVCVYVYICVYISMCIYCVICIRMCCDSYTVRMIECICLYVPYINFIGANNAFSNFAHPQFSSFSRVPEFLTNTYMIKILLETPNGQYLQDVLQLKGSPLKTVKHFAMLPAVSQNYTAVHLFRIGVRYFHANIEYHPDHGVVISNSLIGNSFETAIRELIHELDQNKGEFIILHIHKALCKGGDCAKMDKILSRIFDKSKVYFNPVANLKEIYFRDVFNGGYSIIVIYPRPMESFYMGMHNLNYKTSENIRFAEIHNSMIMKKKPINNLLTIINPVLSSNMSDIIMKLLNDKELLNKFTETYFTEFLYPGQNRYAIYKKITGPLVYPIKKKSNIPFNIVSMNYLTPFIIERLLDLNILNWKLREDMSKVKIYIP